MVITWSTNLMYDLREPDVYVKSLLSDSVSSQCVFLTETVYGTWEKYDKIVQVRGIYNCKVMLSVQGDYLGNNDDYLAIQGEKLEIYDIRKFCLVTSIDINASHSMGSPKAIFFNVGQDLREKIVGARSYRDVMIKCID